MIETLDSGVGLLPYQGGYSSMIPRLSAIVTAWVRSLAPSLESIFVTWNLTVSSLIES